MAPTRKLKKINKKNQASQGAATTPAKWEFFIDRGGTFTDIIAKDPNGQLVVKKFLSEDSANYRDAAIFGIRQLLGLPAGQKIPAALVARIKMGTTVATNALLERKGEKTALVTTAGFTDILRIGGQQRPDIFALQIIKPTQLYDEAVAITERVDVNGAIITPLDKPDTEKKLQELYDKGFRSIAVVFMHGVINPTHEQQVATIAKAIGFSQIALSHQVSPLVKIAPRGDTTVVSAYLSPILHRYVAQVAQELEPGVELLFMQSSGGLTTPAFFHGENSLLSGPAGGVIAAVRVAQESGFTKVLSFDMGGTSTDTAHFDSGDISPKKIAGRKKPAPTRTQPVGAPAYERTFDTVLAGVRVRVPMLKVETLAAGGGSICAFDGAVMTVGPASAGADPGPACYGRGGPLTITDCHVMLGRLRADYFPAIFGPDRDQPLATAIVKEKFSALARQMNKTPEEVAEGFMAIANQKMAAGIKKISIAMGHVIQNHLLVGFGGNGGQHVCAIAETLGLNNILLHPLAGVLSALGIGMAVVTARREQTLGLPLAPESPAKKKILSEQNLNRAWQVMQELTRAATAELTAQNTTPDQYHYQLYCRYRGSDVALPIPFNPEAASVKTIFSQFQQRHQQQFGFQQPVTPADIIMDIVTVAVAGRGAALSPASPTTTAPTKSSPPQRVDVFIDGRWCPIPTLPRAAMAVGQKIIGPAIITEPTSTNFVAPGWVAKLLLNHSLLLTRRPSTKKNVAKKIAPAETSRPAMTAPTNPDPTLLEIFNNRFMAIAEQMGEDLRNTAFSVNIKERLDFSCAIFDADGDLIANAPHIPVHLGSMADSVRHLIAQKAAAKTPFKPGDSFLTNSPYHGGTHLPDITLITPVFIDKKLTFFVAARGHHTDVGGIAPGSMPANSTTIGEEGILIDSYHLVKQGQLQKAGLASLLTAGPHPVRNLAQNFSDIHAQLAANSRGVRELQKTCADHGRAVTIAYMDFMKNQAKAEVEKVIGQLQNGQFSYRTDNGAVISLSLTVDKAARRVKVDFTGTAPQQANNFNAPFAIVKSVLLYVFRTLVDKPMPLNEGCLAAIDIVVPTGSMLAPSYPAAVVAGNVETSQVIADALYGAMGVMAGCQGTMNNLTFGNDRYQYYETIAGGTGAGRKLDGTAFHGADAVHSHMTNSRMTDPEIMEARYPTRIIEYAIRRGSGGRANASNHYHGGDGFTKRILFLEQVTLNILANHRRVAPFGLFGGAAGKVGENYIERADGTIDIMTATDSRLINGGDIFTIHTPGGGGMVCP